MAKNPQTVTVYGRLSYPVFSHKTAVARNLKGKYPKANPAEVAPDFNLLLEQAQYDKFMNHVKNEFFPWLLERQAANETKNALDKKQISQLLNVLDGDLEIQPPYVPVKVVPEKTAELAPEAVVMLKVVGNQGIDIEQKAIVNSEDEMLVPDPDILSYPVVKPISQTVHSMYGGAYVAATLNLYSYISGKLPGFSASAGVAVFKADGERFGGGMAVDEDEIFAD